MFTVWFRYSNGVVLSIFATNKYYILYRAEPLYLFSKLFYYTECVQVLLAYDAPVNIKNLQGQTPLNEAISFGNREIGMLFLLYPSSGKSHSNSYVKETLF